MFTLVPRKSRRRLKFFLISADNQNRDRMFARVRVLLPVLYIRTVIAAGALSLAGGMWNWHSADLAKYLSFMVIALVASGMKINLPSVQGTMSVSFVFTLIGISEFGLGEVLLTASMGALVQSLYRPKNRPKAVQVAFNLANVGIAVRLAYAVHHAPNLQSILLTTSVFFVVNTLMVAIVIALTEQKKAWQVWRDCYFWTFPNFLVGAGAAWAVSATSRVIGWQPSLLLLPILYVIYRSHATYVGRLEEARKRAEQQQAHAEEVAALHRRTIEILALAIEAKDQTTRDHLERVEVYSFEVGKDLGLTDIEIEALRAAALLHDIGKIAVPEYIISKPGKLTPAEFDKMKTHTVVGADMVERIGFPYPVAPLVRGHHEKWDGTGYPDGLAGEQIPMGARILAAVDCLDALSSDRQYRRAMPLNEALDIVQAQAGKSFDPRVVEVLVRRGVEISNLVKGSERIARLPVDIKVDRGAAPATGFENSPSQETASLDLVNLSNAVTDGRARAGSLASCIAALRASSDRAGVCTALKSFLPGVVSSDLQVLYMCEGERMIPVYVQGDEYRTFAETEIRTGTGLSGWVAENRMEILNGNPSVEPGYLKDPDRFSDLRHALAVPLMSADGVWGVLSLYRKGNPFTNEHLEALTALSPLLREALELTAV
jgi:putative nucleotidyltransferase with HDIG domain